METGFKNGWIKDGTVISSPLCSTSCLDLAVLWCTRCINTSKKDGMGG
jgi:hypothetical protein